MNLKNFQTIIKYLFIPLLFIITLTFVGSWWLFFKSPPPEEKFGRLSPVTIDSVLSEKIGTVNTAVIRNIPKVPKIANIYVKESKIDGKTLADRLDFKSDPKKIGDQLVWRNGAKTLKFNATTAYFSFKNQQEIKRGKLTEEEAVSRAKQVLKELGLIDDTSDIVVENVKRLLGTAQGHAAAVEGEAKFDIYAISFGFRRGGFNVINENGNQNLIEIWVGLDKSIQKIGAGAQPLEFRDQSTYKIKSVKDTIEELKQARGILVNVGAPIKTTFEIITIRYTSVQLAYLLTDKDKFLQPVYLFKGLTSGIGNELVEVKAIIPALSE